MIAGKFQHGTLSSKNPVPGPNSPTKTHFQLRYPLIWCTEPFDLRVVAERAWLHTPWCNAVRLGFIPAYSLFSSTSPEVIRKFSFHWYFTSVATKRYILLFGQTLDDEIVICLIKTPWEAFGSDLLCFIINDGLLHGVLAPSTGYTG